MRSHMTGNDQPDCRQEASIFVPPVRQTRTRIKNALQHSDQSARVAVGKSITPRHRHRSRRRLLISGSSVGFVIEANPEPDEAPPGDTRLLTASLERLKPVPVHRARRWSGSASSSPKNSRSICQAHA